MAFMTSAVEYGLHCLLWLVDQRDDPASSRDLAELQGVPPALLAKIFPKLQKAGIVEAVGGIAGGYRLGRDADAISVLDIVDAVEGEKSLFHCQEVRRNCALFGAEPPDWSSGGVCAIHAVMLRAEASMRAELARTTLADISETVRRKSPPEFRGEVGAWLGDRRSRREEARVAALRRSPKGDPPDG
jgi:Rrf2 family protein